MAGERQRTESPKRSLGDLWERFLTGGDVAGEVKGAVVESWTRSLAAGVDPESHVLPPTLYATNDLEAYRAGHPLASLHEALRSLTQECVDSGQLLVAVADADGVLLWVDGAPDLRRRAETINFVPGTQWDEGHAGTNAPALAVRSGGEAQVLAAEHFSKAVQRWSCAAVAVRDPETAGVLGVVDLTWPAQHRWSYALATARSCAKALEGEMYRLADERRAVARERYLEKALVIKGPTALVGPAGRVLLAPSVPALVGSTVLAGASPDTAVLPDGSLAEVRCLGTEGYAMLCLPRPRRSRSSGALPSHPSASLTALGRSTAVLEAGGRTIALRPRFAEIVVLLALHPEGLSSEKLGMLLLGDESNPVTVRAEMSRLRVLLGPALVKSRPYRLACPVHADFFKISAALRDGRLRAALRDYSGPLLPLSDAPGICEERRHLELQLRAAVLSTRDPGILRKWVESPWGADDAEAWEVLASELPYGSSARAAAAAQAAELLGTVGGRTTGARRCADAHV